MAQPEVGTNLPIIITPTLILSYSKTRKLIFSHRGVTKPSNTTIDAINITAAIQRRLFCDRFLKRPLLTVSRSFMNVANRVVVKDGDYFEGQ
jgi:hypothetical protein